LDLESQLRQQRQSGRDQYLGAKLKTVVEKIKTVMEEDLLAKVASKRRRG
jgi:hypothetical protein